MHRSYGLQGSLKRRYKHPFPASINEYYTAKNGLGTIAPRLLSRVKVGTHSALFKGSHTAAYTPKQGPSGRGRYHYPRSVPHVHKHPRAGYQNGKLCRFWVLVGDAPKEHRKPSGQRCAYACRCPEGVAAPLGCVIFSLLSKLRPVRPIPETSFSSPDAPACAVPVQATSQLVSFRLEADRGFSVLSLCLTSFFDFGDKKRPLISHTAV